MPDAWLTVLSAANPAIRVRWGVSTSADGRFRITNVPLGTYKLQIQLPGVWLTQFWPGQTDVASADTFTIAAFGEEKTLNDEVVAHGTITGHITTSTGSPAGKALVGLQNSGNTKWASVVADADGGYRFDYVAAGSYVMSVTPATFVPTQWMHGKTTLADADPITVAVGAPTVVNERLLATGEITGVVTDRGTPVAHAGVEVWPTTSNAQPVYVSADENGRYRLPLLPGQYKLQFLGSYDRLEQWWPNADDQAGADAVTVTAGGSVVADLAVLPSTEFNGAIYLANGDPADGVTLVLTEVNTGRTYNQQVWWNWHSRVRPGTYTARFELDDQVQWYHGATTAETAQPIVLPPYGSTTVEETFLGPASVDVTATDAVTGAVVNDFCATLGGTANAYRCTSSGVASFQVSAGTYSVTVDDGDHLVATVDGIKVATGDRLTRAVALKHGGAIEFTAVDARTGAPVPNACLKTRPVDRAPEPAEGNYACTDASGRYTFPRVIPDRYQLFAPVYDDVHGAQWVGPHGGVGSQDDAKVFTVRAGVTTRVVVRFDGRGSISGVVTDRATGRPVAAANVNIGGMVGGIVGIADTDGRYTLDGLGPYTWKLAFWHEDYAGQWSGAVADRDTAKTVRVQVGRTARYNLPMRKGTAVTGLVSTPAGAPLNWAMLTVYDASTHDHRNYAAVNADGTYRTWVLGPQKVHIIFEGSVDGVRAHEWWRDGKTFADADVRSVPSSGTVTANITLSP